MQGQTNLYRRGSVYWFSKKVPVDLKAHYASVPSGIFRFSLRTRDRAEAKALATARAAEYDQEFQQVRARLSAPVSPLSPDGLRLLTLAWTSHLLEEDEAERIEGGSAWMRWLGRTMRPSFLVSICNSSPAQARS